MVLLNNQYTTMNSFDIRLMIPSSAEKPTRLYIYSIKQLLLRTYCTGK